MSEELARTVAGLPVAALWPLTLPYLARSPVRVAALAFASALYVLLPQLPSPSSIVLLVLTTATTFVLWCCSARAEAADPKRRLFGPTLCAALVLALAAAVLTDFDRARDAVEATLESERVALTAIGLTACVFLGGSVVAWILAPFTKKLKAEDDATDLPSLDNAGRYIGWFERAVLFAFVLGGQPQAAVIALAAKSFARFPTLREHHEGFAEYFLIGSLASLTVAVVAAIATRATLGFDLLP